MKESLGTLPLRCVFCRSTKFLLPHEDYRPQPGEALTCGNCGRRNDFDSLMRIVKMKGAKIAEDYAREYIEKELADAFKKAGFKVR